jgi:hypothetical protein
MKDPKSIAVMLLGKKAKAEEPSDEMGDEEPKMPALEEVMGDMISALKADDAAGAAKAFRAALACADEAHNDDTEE